MSATASKDTGAAVVAERLAKRFDSAMALDDVSLTVNRGELFGVIGPDGAGKTTLFRILTTLLVPDGGSARVLGVDVVAGLWELRRRVGYMPGRFSLYPDLSVEENLRFFASVFGTTIEREYDHIAPIYSQLEPFNGRRAAALSGGMKQKLALCCALVHRPEILFLDEPTTGVDAVSRREFWELLARLRTDGLTIVVSTPYMDEANRCGRVALVQQGRVLTVDNPAAITAAFGRPLLAVRASNRYAALRALDGYPNAERAYPFSDVMHLVDRRTGVSADELVRDAAAYLHGRGIADAVVSEAAPTIEDAFIDRMGAPEGEAAIARGAA
jgi:ABC-2 type transport system ATP-binding protein